MVPEEMRPEALAMIPWEREPAVYRSDLGDRLPVGLTMPAARRVADVDDLSAALWLDAVDVQPVSWDVPRFEQAARLLGRLAASQQVAPLGAIGETPQLHRRYAAGRVAGQVLPALHDDGFWRHPVLAAGFDIEVRDGLRGAAARLPGFLRRAGHLSAGHQPRRRLPAQPAGPAGMPGRRLVRADRLRLLGSCAVRLRPEPAPPRRGADRRAAGVGPARCSRAAIVPAYVNGLAAEGAEVELAVVQRTHVLLALLFNGLSAMPFELLAGPPDDEAVRVTRERCEMARFLLDLEASTKPLL